MTARSLVLPAFALGVLVHAACGADEPAATSSTSTASTGSGGASSSTTAATTTSTSVVSTTGAGGAGGLPGSFEVQGIVTDGALPVEGAIVMQGGGVPALVTGADGAFTLTLSTSIAGDPVVVAAKTGYRSAGLELTSLPEGPVELVLRVVSLPDNTSYVYGDPGQGDAAIDTSTLFCGHCHTTLVAQFRASAHARSAKDPLVQDLYAGVTQAHPDQASCEAAGGSFRTGKVPGTASTPIAKCYLGGGVLPDLNPTCGAPGGLACDDPALPAASKPVAFGACADCHAPGIDGPAGDRDLLEAVGVAYDAGNHCDFCHHVADVDLAKPPGAGHRLQVQRPFDKVSPSPGSQLLQVMFGPLPDVPTIFMGGSYQPKFSTSEICAGCHEQNQPALIAGQSLDAARWPDGLPVHSTYAEWRDGPFNTPTTPCQSCHMPADDTGLTNSVDVTDLSNAGLVFGFARKPEQIRKHIFRGPLEGAPRLIQNSIAVFLATQASAGQLTVTVTLQNIGAGHAIPTGEPMRSMLLLVDATACGSPIAATAGPTLNDVGGALAEGIVATDVVASGATLTWAAGALAAKVGDVVRVVRPTGAFDDYPGIGFFADPLLTPAAKGLPLRAPVGEAHVVSIAGAVVTLDAALAVQPGDVAYLGEALTPPVGDGSASLALAGSPGVAFARTLVDATGARQVPHHRAVDIASDNRIAPGAQSASTHVFTTPPGCAAGTVRASVVYRPIPLALARPRGWAASDYVIASASENVALPP